MITKKVFSLFRYLKYPLTKFLVILFCIGCNPKVSSEKETQLLALMQNQQIDLDRKQMIVIISGGCNPCKEQSISFLKKISNDKRYGGIAKTVIIPKNEKEVIQILKQTKLKILVDEMFSIEKYGFHLSKSLLIELNKDNEVIYWKEMTTETISEIENQYKIP